MLTVRIPSIGEILVDLETLMQSRGHFTICGHDEDHNDYVLTLAKISWQEDYIYEFGWTHVVAYTMQGVTTPCNHYTAIG